MKSFEWLLVENEKDIDSEKSFLEVKRIFLKDTNLSDIVNIDRKKDLIKLIAAFRLARTAQSQKGEYFISDKHKLAFCLKHNGSRNFDKELGITRKHYLSKDLAKEWRDALIAKFHPDKNIDENFKENEEITESINQIYNRMAGKA